MLSHSEEIIFLEAIDQNFESDSESDPKNDETNENLEEMNAKLCEKLEEDENISTENDSYESLNENKTINTTKKYILMKNCVYINKNNIDELMANIYENYKSQIEILNKNHTISKP